jgi:hypothetical protein
MAVLDDICPALKIPFFLFFLRRTNNGEQNCVIILEINRRVNKSVSYF